MLQNIPSGVWVCVALILGLLIVQGLAKIGKAEYKRQMVEHEKKLARIPASYLTLSHLQMTWAATGIPFYLPLVKPITLAFEDVCKGDFTQTKYVRIGHDFEAQRGFLHAVHVVIAEVTLNRNGVVEIKALPRERDNISKIDAHLKLNHGPQAIFNMKEQLRAA